MAFDIPLSPTTIRCVIPTIRQQDRAQRSTSSNNGNRLVLLSQNVAGHRH